MGCGGSKPSNDSPSEPVRTAKLTYKPTGPGHTLGGSGDGSTGATSSVPSSSRPNAGSAAAAAAAKRDEAQRAAAASAKTKLKPQSKTTDGNQNVTNSDTLAWN